MPRMYVCHHAETVSDQSDKFDIPGQEGDGPSHNPQDQPSENVRQTLQRTQKLLFVSTRRYGKPCRKTTPGLFPVKRLKRPIRSHKATMDQRFFGIDVAHTCRIRVLEK